MTPFEVLAFIVTAGLTVYLFVALLVPERFQ